VYDQFDLPDEARLLEIGCGTGSLWSENFDRIPDGWEITLTDASPGMVAEAKRNLGDSRRFVFRVADGQELPFEDGTFDAVVANHMLYHVPNRPRELSEIARVLREGGTLYAATNGMEHLRELVGMLRVLDPTHRSESIATDLPGFTLENGAEQLSPWFPEVSLRQYEGSLIVTEAKPLVDSHASQREHRLAMAFPFGTRSSVEGLARFSAAGCVEGATTDSMTFHITSPPISGWALRRSCRASRPSSSFCALGVAFELELTPERTDNYRRILSDYERRIEKGKQTVYAPTLPARGQWSEWQGPPKSTTSSWTSMCEEDPLRTGLRAAALRGIRGARSRISYVLARTV
jgi:SAM-dependent methyltransferase